MMVVTTIHEMYNYLQENILKSAYFRVLRPVPGQPQ